MGYPVFVNALQSSGEAELLAKPVCQALLVTLMHNHFSNVYLEISHRTASLSNNSSERRTHWR